MRRVRLFDTLIVTIELVVGTTPAMVESQTGKIRLNQIGFYPNGPKIAVVVGAPTNEFYVTTPDFSDTVFSGVLESPQLWTYSNETVRKADFSSERNTGEFVLIAPGLGHSHPFEIEPHVHQEAATAALKGFYYQRASTSLPPQYALAWGRALGHPDNEVIVHPSAASANRPAGSLVSSPKGWYDAGDYNKYIVNSGITTYTLLSAYEHFPDYFEFLDTNIPESGNNIPDILDEVLWNLRWMLTMQDPDDGGVYHKLTNPNFEGMVMPSQAKQPRYVVQKSTSATLNFTAVMAVASRIFENYSQELPNFPDSCLTAALQGWNWARQHPDIYFDQGELNANHSPSIHTGEYGDKNVQDEFDWAATELYITTGQDSFIAVTDPFSDLDIHLPWWQRVSTLGLYSLMQNRSQLSSIVDTSAIKASLISWANGLKSEVSTSAYGVLMGQSTYDFAWGSNSVAANQGIVMIQAYRLTEDSSYLEAAIANLDYLLGRNATGFSFLTGYGDRTPKHPHHRPSEADGFIFPVPGLLVGGPNPGQQDGCPGYPGNLPALSYIDSWCSYASNEIAINWNAPLVYLAASIEAILYERPKMSSAIPRNEGLPDNFILTQNYPNPFNSMTTIPFRLPHVTRVNLSVYNIQGERVETLVSESMKAGDHSVVWKAGNIGSGIYLYKISTDQFTAIKKCLLIK